MSLEHIEKFQWRWYGGTVAVNVVSLAEGGVYNDDVGEGNEGGVDKALWAKSKTISEFLEILCFLMLLRLDFVKNRKY